MASSSNRKSGSSGRSTARKRVVIGAEETVRVRYRHNQPEVESERKKRQKRTGASSRQRPTSGAGRKLASKKRTERERRQQGIRLRRSALVAAVVFLLGLVCWGLVALYNAPLFTITSVTVSGNSHLTRAEALRLAAVPKGATLVRVPRSAIERRLEATPWVISASVDRDFPDTLHIRLVERTPAVIVDQGGADLWVVSRDGFWLGPRSAEETGLVQVTGLPKLPAKAGRKVGSREVLNAVAVVAGLSEELRKSVVSIDAPSVDKTALRTADDVEIFVGEASEMGKKDRVARGILKQHPGAVYVNVRVPDDPTWRGLQAEPE